LGVPLVIVTTITASELFNTMAKDGENAFPVKFADFDATITFLVVCAMLAPVLAALQTFLRFPERAEQHRKAAVNFGLLKKEVERLLAFPPEPVELKARVEELQKRDVQIMKGVPTIGSLSRKKARRILAQRDPALVRFIRRLTFNILP
ncbi:MAG: SLATT domain-containing protein, partial [Desulfobacterales bacterium]|nr:SLATT domain-containing protein [Desulfobacterales bacterium]